MIFEIIGYVASFFTALSLLMVNIIKLRLFNLVGCITFIVYGSVLGSIPIIVTNSFILIINVYNLVKLFSHNLDSFTYIPLKNDRKTQMEDFFNNFRNDINLHFPFLDFDKMSPAFSGSGKVFLAIKELEEVGFSCFIPIQSLPPALNDDEKIILDYSVKNLYPESTVYLLADYIRKKYRNIGVDKRMYQNLIGALPENTKFILSIGQSRDRQNDRYLRKNNYKPVKNFGDYTLYLRTVHIE